MDGCLILREMYGSSVDNPRCAFARRSHFAATVFTNDILDVFPT